MKRLAWILALAVLAAALVVFNLPEPATQASAEVTDSDAADPAAGAVVEEPSAEEASVSGDAADDVPGTTSSDGDTETNGSATDHADPSLYASDAPVGSEVGDQLPDFTLQTLDGEDFVLSAHRGKVVVLNFWATWCTPCVNELPHFDRLQAEHPEDVAVLAVHSDFTTADVPAYVEDLPYGIAFALDASGDVGRMVGGTTSLPRTLVLNARGEIIYNQPGSVTYEVLEELVTLAQSPADD